ncbi:sulfuric ester hydrolase [Aureococcus anophagefferens]|nr:sulfuric ester hydrolase [Aureococcus anophagefferens]
MPKTQKLLVDGGALFTSSFVHTPVCCPSRAETLTGRYLHNLKTPGVCTTPYDGFDPVTGGACCMHVEEDKVHDASFAAKLKRAGYATGMFQRMFGKYLNFCPGDCGDECSGAPIPEAFDAYLANGGGHYFGPSFAVKNVDGLDDGTYDAPADAYTTSVVGNYSAAWIESVKAGAAPFLAYVAPKAAHDLPAGGLDRWRTLMSVDDLVAGIFDALGDALEDTFVFYTSDHGYSLGELNLNWDKRHVYDFDTRVHLVARGPGVRPGAVVDAPFVTNVDLAPTFLDLAGVDAGDDVDGRSFAPWLRNATVPWRDEVFVEYAYVGIGPYCSMAEPIEQSDNNFVAVRRRDLLYAKFVNGTDGSVDFAGAAHHEELFFLDDDPTSCATPCAGPACPSIGSSGRRSAATSAPRIVDDVARGRDARASNGSDGRW